MGMINVVTNVCPKCGLQGIVQVDPEKYKAWKSGKIPYVQHAFPDMSIGLREQLMTGYHSACFDADFPDEDEDEDEEPDPEDEDDPYRPITSFSPTGKIDMGEKDTTAKSEEDTTTKSEEDYAIYLAWLKRGYHS